MTKSVQPLKLGPRHTLTTPWNQVSCNSAACDDLGPAHPPGIPSSIVGQAHFKMSLSSHPYLLPQRGWRHFLVSHVPQQYSSTMLPFWLPSGLAVLNSLRSCPIITPDNHFLHLRATMFKCNSTAINGFAPYGA